MARQDGKLGRREEKSAGGGEGGNKNTDNKTDREKINVKTEEKK